MQMPRHCGPRIRVNVERIRRLAARIRQGSTHLLVQYVDQEVGLTAAGPEVTDRIMKFRLDAASLEDNQRSEILDSCEVDIK